MSSPAPPLSEASPVPPARQTVRVPKARALEAARLLVVGVGPERDRAARRLLRNAAGLGIRFDLCWATADESEGPFRAACLAVPGPGRTAMLFLSEGPKASEASSETALHACRVDAVRGAIAGIREASGQDLVLSQALPEPEQTWAGSAFASAGMQRVTELLYLRRPLKMPGDAPPAPSPELPEGVTVEPLGSANTGIDSRSEAALATALERTYIDTLDCPELCGLRTVADTIASHKSTGQFDPSLWWIVRMGGKPEGCVLLSRCAEHDAIELVYLGLGPNLRGQGVGCRLMRWAIGQLAGESARELTCAVDARNEPARRLYERLGFRKFTSRMAFVAPLR